MTKSTTAAEAANAKKEIRVAAPGAIWRYFLLPSPQEAADFANLEPAQHAGEAVFSVRDDLQTDTFLFF